MRKQKTVLWAAVAAAVILGVLLLGPFRPIIEWAESKAVNWVTLISSPLYPIENLTAKLGGFVRRPYLQSPALEEITIVWALEQSGNCTVRYGQDSLDRIIQSSGMSDHAVRLQGLDAGTMYTYTVECISGDDIIKSQAKTFTTSKPAGESIRFVVVGDSGGATEAQMNLARVVEQLNPDFIVHLGDVAYQRNDIPRELGPYEAVYFLPYQEIIDEIAVFPVLGNHDYKDGGGAPYLNLFYLPESAAGGERFYAFDYGLAQFFALDTNQEFSPGSTQYLWLEQELNHSDAEWTVMFMHHPMYSGGVHGNTPGLEEALFPLIEQYGVDLVLAGHDHNFERTNLLGESNTLFIVSGGGGRNVRRVKPTENTAFAVQKFHIVEIVIDDKTLGLKAYDENGQVFDTFAFRH